MNCGGTFWQGGLPYCDAPVEKECRNIIRAGGCAQGDHGGVDRVMILALDQLWPWADLRGEREEEEAREEE